jgi:hypothetical protein
MEIAMQIPRTAGSYAIPESCWVAYLNDDDVKYTIV